MRGGLYRTRGRCRSDAARPNLCHDPLVTKTRKRRKIAHYGNTFAKLSPNGHATNASNTVSAPTGKHTFIARHLNGHKPSTLAQKSSLFPQPDRSPLGVRGEQLPAPRTKHLPIHPRRPHRTVEVPGGQPPARVETFYNPGENLPYESPGVRPGQSQADYGWCL
jgi:hypothetical protein